MHPNALQTFIDATRAAWGPLSSPVVASVRQSLQTLIGAPPSDAWLAHLLTTAPAHAELYRDPEHGFVLLTHTEQSGQYRPPHDHGRSWVIYAVQHGTVEMGTYARSESPQGSVRLVQRDRTILRAGDVQVYLPGDIHDTRCLSPSALLFRFTERDLQIEDQQEHRVTRYVQQGDVWTPRTTCPARPGPC